MLFIWLSRSSVCMGVSPTITTTFVWNQRTPSKGLKKQQVVSSIFWMVAFVLTYPNNTSTYHHKKIGGSVGWTIIPEFEWDVIFQSITGGNGLIPCSPVKYFSLRNSGSHWHTPRPMKQQPGILSQAKNLGEFFGEGGHFYHWQNPAVMASQGYSISNLLMFLLIYAGEAWSQRTCDCHHLCWMLADSDNMWHQGRRCYKYAPSMLPPLLVKKNRRERAIQLPWNTQATMSTV